MKEIDQLFYSIKSDLAATEKDIDSELNRLEVAEGEEADRIRCELDMMKASVESMRKELRSLKDDYYG